MPWMIWNIKVSMTLHCKVGGGFGRSFFMPEILAEWLFYRLKVPEIGFKGLVGTKRKKVCVVVLLWHCGWLYGRRGMQAFFQSDTVSRKSCGSYCASWFHFGPPV